MHRLIAGLASISDTFMVRRYSENCHLNFSLTAVCGCGIS